ncbi:PREDICTED: erlin-2-like [Priapulus caudatus]|uniref:Erlin-2-like n=1 Tax=Priapulus caudatus TaxID=37621 RepID=A0ABM1F2X0_PRICU|nr:PREDICTED: erlin-2-like [Priapulus caudatus]
MDSSHLAKIKAAADADYYATLREADANKILLTTEYIKLKELQAVANNRKVYFGTDIPTMLMDSRMPEDVAAATVAAATDLPAADVEKQRRGR